ncbi:MAG TPA: adenylate/guanylate cyclase domain-containing protein [Gaiellaceae bacterium]
MSEYSIDDVAARAGAAHDYVSRLVELGVVSVGEGGGFSEGDVRRVRLMQTLERAGVPLEEVAAAIRRGELSLGFLDMSHFTRLSSLSGVTFQELSEKTNVPVELLLVIREAAGFAEAHPTDRARENELQIVPLIEAQVALGFRLPVIERWLRAYGDSLRRIAETEGEWWHTEIELPLLESGMTAAEMMEAADGRVVHRIVPFLDQALVALYHGHQEHAWTKNFLDGIEAALSGAGVHSRVERPPAICFLDIAGYTRLTEERGDEAAAELAGTMSRIVQRTSTSHGGRPIKWLGDGVMFHFPEPGPGVIAALDMVEGIAGAGLPPAHVGLHAGPVLFQEGDYFGRTVNIASRIADYARPGEVVVSQPVVDAAEATPVSFVEIGPVELKGLSESIRLHTARRDARAPNG